MAVIDFIPKISPVGDFLKIKDTDTLNYNNKVSTLLNFMLTVPGSNSIFPEYGAWDLLQSLPYAENPENVIESISSHCSRCLGYETSFSHTTDDQTGLITLSIEINGLPGLLQVDMAKAGTYYKLFNPRYLNS